MAESLMDRLEHAWNVFRGRNTSGWGSTIGSSSSSQRTRGYATSSKLVIAPILNQISLDAAGIEIRHVKLNADGKYEDDIKSYLNECLMVSPNLDQGPTHFLHDVYMTMLEEGVVAVVPVETTINPDFGGSFDITQLRAGSITGWLPKHVKVNLYNQDTGRREEVVLEKESVCIVESPLYSILNEPNSTLQRLIAKLSLLDVTDDRLASGKLDIILQLPYTIKHETRQLEANKRIRGLEEQIAGSKYGVGYIDGTERITQLNRPSENNLLEQVKSLEIRLHSQLGLTEDIFLGKADEATMLNYQNRTIFPIVQSLQQEMKRKLLTKNARTRGHSIMYFQNPFKFVPIKEIAEIADKFTRNEIMSPNEVRPIVGLKPVNDPKADELRNRNMPLVDEKTAEAPKPDLEETPTPTEGSNDEA